MPTSWQRADDNVLRAHLQEALSERAATADPSDWSYSEYEVAAIRAELDARRTSRAQDREIPAGPPDTECGPPSGSPTAVDADLDRLRILIARCCGRSPRMSAAPAVARSCHVAGRSRPDRRWRDAPPLRITSG